MSDKLRESLEKRVQKAIFQHALFRWESAVVIALTLLLAAFGPAMTNDTIPSWGWMIGGLLSEAALIYSSMSDVEIGEQIVADLLKADFKPERLRTAALQKQVNKALDYRRRIADAIRTKDDGVLKDQLTQTATQIDEWLENIYNLAVRLDVYQEQQPILSSDRDRAEKRLAQLRQKLAHEDNSSVHSEMETTIESMNRQVATIEAVENTMQRASLQLENSLSHLGTIYSQAVLVGAKDIDSGRAKRLQAEISEEVIELGDILSAMDEVYAQQDHS